MARPAMLALSWVAAVVACLGYGAGSVLQSVGAQRTARVPGVTGVALIIRQGPYLLGLAVDVLAFVANVVALQRLPLFLVQSILTASVGVTAVIAALRGTRLAGRDWASLGVLGLGLVLLSLSAASESAVQISLTARYVILACALVPALLGLVGTRSTGRVSALTLTLAAGLSFAGVAVSARGISGEPVRWILLADPLVWTLVADGVLGTVFFALALQRSAVTLVTAVVFMVEMVVPSAVGMVLFADSVLPGMGVFAAAGFVLAVVGTVTLSRFAE